MRFAALPWLAGCLLALGLGVLLVLGGFWSARRRARLGEASLIDALVTHPAATRRVTRGVLLVVALLSAFVAAAQPQYGRGTRLIPATNLDVVLVIDFSKSMLARDVTPSRIQRAQGEVARLITDLAGARFGAVAFAGEPLAFPLTSDGAAIAQFFRQLTPADMPVGGTAIARALESARELLARDPLSKDHRRVLVLVTDGEDLEGDPVGVAEAAGREGTAVWVVQIGGRTPEPLPEVDELGRVVGQRTDEQGRVLTTSLSAEGEAQLARIAEVSQGRVVRSLRGETGIGEVTTALRQLQTAELGEQVETVYADVYAYPLGLCLLLLLLEAFFPEAPRRVPPPPPPPARRRRAGVTRGARRAAAASVLLALAGAAAVGCERDPFERWAPPVDRAIAALDAGDASAAASELTDYLSTGPCAEGQIGAPDRLGQRPQATLDLGLALFALGERYGQRFGEEELGPDGGAPAAPERSAQIDCALRVARSIASDVNVPLPVRARAHYLAGNLEFLRRDYKTAITAYDAALELSPGLPPDAGDALGADVAWNRAIALRRQEEQRPDAAPDAAPDSSPEGGEGGSPEGGSDEGGAPEGGEGGAEGGDPQGSDGGGQDQDGGGGGQDAGAPPGRDAGGPPPPALGGATQDERLLDDLERAPTFQHQGAQQRGRSRLRPLEDK